MSHDIKELLTLAANEWMLIGPGGQMWKTSETRELIRVLSPYAMKEMFP